MKAKITLEPEAEEEEDTPVIKQLKAIDDKYCAIEVEFEREKEKLNRKYEERRAPLIEKRKQVLCDTAEADADAKELGTPACPEFWATALSNASEIEECFHECDEPVLKYLDDVKKSDIDVENPQKGVRLEFVFKENQFFTNTTLWFEVHFDYNLDTYKPYKELECIEVKASPVEWKAGKDVTVEKTKEVKAATKKGKRKPGKVKEEPQPSFFRILFTSVKKDDPLPESLECIYNEEDAEDEDLAEVHLANMGSVAQFMSECLIPYAVRYYTGEACEDEVDDDSEDPESEDDDDDDDDDDEDDDSEDEAPARAKGAKKKPQPKKDAAGEKTEECKQQ